MNNNNLIITANDNVSNIDLVGKHLLNAAIGGHGIDPLTCAVLSKILVDCRLYSTVRDRDIISPEINKNFLAIFDAMKHHQEEAQKKEVSVEDAAQQIINDLRNSGINI